MTEVIRIKLIIILKEEMKPATSSRTPEATLLIIAKVGIGAKLTKTRIVLIIGGKGITK